MNNRILFFMLTLFFMGTASMNAQVNIGSVDGPTPGTVLDLSKSGKQLGLRLPVVSLSGETPFQLTDGGDGSLAAGTVVYNDGKGALNATGIYVWDGRKWLQAGTTGTFTPLTAFTLSTIGLTFTVGDANQDVNVVTWDPADADIREVTWEITGGNGDAGIVSQTVNSVTVKAGTVEGDNILTATPKPGSGTATPQTVTIRTNEADAVDGTELPNGVYEERTGYVTDAPFKNWVATGATLKVACADLAGGGCDWQPAMDNCAALGDGWRLPNIAELVYMKNQRLKLVEGGCADLKSSWTYWSSTRYSADKVWLQDGKFNGATNAVEKGPRLARCVRTI
jgi:hypothetical protein